MDATTAAVIALDGLDALVARLHDHGYHVLGPTVRDGAIAYDELESAADLPVGWTDRQDAGTYSLERRNDDACFGYAVGPHSWKRELFPPRVRLFTADRDANGVAAVAEEPTDDAPLALVGVRPCELAAIAIQDRVLMRDRDYAARRSRLFVVAVNCFEPGGTCFCASLRTGPRVDDGYDLALTELLDRPHRFLVEVRSEDGRALLDEIPHREATGADLTAATAAVEAASERMGRTMDAQGLRDLLLSSLDDPHWDDVASRCLSCANCTLVCPTCFCTTVEDATDLTGDHAERLRVWDTCFSVDYSYIHGGSIRPSGRSRYRQWLTHKLATWHDQFGTSGCVGCGRCITWCPVGIDITAEVDALRAARGDERAVA